MPLFFTFLFFFHSIHYRRTSHHTIFFLYGEAGVYEWSCSGITWISSHICDEAGASYVFSMESVVLRLQSVAEFFGLSPQLGLEPAPHTSEALADRYLNGSQLILGI